MDLELHPFMVAFGDLALTFGANNLVLVCVNCVLIAPSIPHEAKHELVTRCLVSDKECLVVPDSYEISACQVEIRLHDLPFLAVQPIGLSRVEQLAKRTL